LLKVLIYFNLLSEDTFIMSLRKLLPAETGKETG